MKILKLILVFYILLMATAFEANAGIKESATSAITAKNVYIPTLLALTVALSPIDGKVTEYASKHRPLFHTINGAKRYSDAITFYALPALAVSSSIHRYNYQQTSEIGLTSILPTLASTYALNYLIKDRSGRIRPDESNSLSFPSAHTSLASAQTEHIYNNSFSKRDSLGARIILESVTASVAWARLEAKKHHLSDVLAGYAIGKFISNFFESLYFDENTSITIQSTNLKNYGVYITCQY